ncbi:hypothetical protein CXF97_03225 [Pseudomonas sp. Choline-02u-1]|nr:hypothetical protein CXF97_03225 [Pseudomonas sp. Choline-02u-1]
MNMTIVTLQGYPFARRIYERSTGHNRLAGFVTNSITGASDRIFTVMPKPVLARGHSIASPPKCVGIFAVTHYVRSLNFSRHFTAWADMFHRKTYTCVDELTKACLKIHRTSP